MKFAVLGPAETCTGDPARRMGNEFVFSMLAQQNIETLNEAKPRTIVASCPHCFNALANEYPQFGGNYEVIHHTQLLARLVAEGKLTPVTPVAEKITYHDPCFLGRHNKVFSPPREIMEQVPGVQPQEMHRCKERGFCCGAGGARMWMEERIGKRINTERIDEALGTNPDTVSTACPYCLVMLGDAIAAKKASGEAPESLEIVDVAQLLARSVQPPPGCRTQPPPAAPANTGTMSTGRAEAFSDGVFAIAITLLVLSLRLPGNGTVTSQLLAAWPQYFAYVVSFLTIGIMWMNHHTILAHVAAGGPAAPGAEPAAAHGHRGHPVPHRPGRGHLTHAGGHRRRGDLRARHDRDLVRVRRPVDLRGDPCPGPRRGLAARGAAQVHPRVHRRPGRLRGGHPDRGVLLAAGRP